MSYIAHCSHHSSKRVSIQNTLKRIQITKNCEVCDKEFDVIRKIQKDGTITSNKEKACCSAKCSNKLAVLTRESKIKNIRHDDIIRECVFCKKELTHPKRRNKNPHCSIKCTQNHKLSVRYELAKTNNSYINITTKPATVKAIIVFKHGHKCMICGITEWRKEKVPITLDHINGNSDDWSFVNLRIICRNCDGLLPTFAGRNIGSNKIKSKRMIEQSKRIKDGKQKHKKVE